MAIDNMSPFFLITTEFRFWHLSCSTPIYSCIYNKLLILRMWWHLILVFVLFLFLLGCFLFVCLFVFVVVFWFFVVFCFVCLFLFCFVLYFLWFFLKFLFRVGSGWVIDDLGHVIDHRQFGKVPGVSTSHYLTNLVYYLYLGIEKKIAT